MCCTMVQDKRPELSMIPRNLWLRFYFNTGAQIHPPLFPVSRKNHSSVLFCDCRWSYRTTATTQRRKERHRQQTEHLGLDNDLKEVGEISLRLQSVTCCSCCSPCWSLTLWSVQLSPQCAKYPSTFLLIVT